jgi:hypothetical protein
MAELAHGTQPEFWRPPVPSVEKELAVQETATSMAQVCPGCGTEYLLGSRFCHSCGGKRPGGIASTVKADVGLMVRLREQLVEAARTTASVFSLPDSKVPSWVHYLSFHDIKMRLGLPTASLIAFFIGVGCIAGALLVGLLSAKTLVDWQAIQFYRAEWLLAATASFAAGILLKKPSDTNH